MELLRTTLSRDEYSDHDAYYLDLVRPEEKLLTTLLASLEKTLAVFTELPAHLHDYRYAPGKWTIKDVVQHMIDVERVFGYRMLRFARADPQALPGFDEDEYGRVQDTSRRTMDELLEEFAIVRRGNVLMLGSFSAATLVRQGTASERRASVRALGFKLAGHDRHHLKVIKERYLEG